MTIHNRMWLVCDHEGCGNVLHGTYDGSFQQLRAEAVAAGWKVERFNPKAHLCPAHVVSRGVA
jgi:hypothetical protein